MIINFIQGESEIRLIFTGIDIHLYAQSILLIKYASSLFQPILHTRFSK